MDSTSIHNPLFIVERDQEDESTGITIHTNASAIVADDDLVAYAVLLADTNAAEDDLYNVLREPVSDLSHGTHYKDGSTPRQPEDGDASLPLYPGSVGDERGGHA